MTALLTGLSIAWLIGALISLCRRQSRPQIVILPVMLVRGDVTPDDTPETWARKQIDALETKS